MRMNKNFLILLLFILLDSHVFKYIQQSTWMKVYSEMYTFKNNVMDIYLQTEHMEQLRMKVIIIFVLYLQEEFIPGE